MPVISKFFSGKSIFLTGGTGFLGGAVIEKLLRSCPEVDRIYLLVRSKKGLSGQKRVDQVIESAVFDRVRRSQPTAFRKLIPVCGDISEEGLGLSDVDRRTLINNVSIIIHGAASVSFVNSLRDSVSTTIYGAKRSLELAKELKTCNSFIHTSTAFAHPEHKVTEEKMYDPPVHMETVLSMLKNYTDDQLAVQTKHMLRNSRHYNTYTFCKAIGEKVVDTEKEHVPTCIVRPSSVCSAISEPFPGWIGNKFGYSAIFGAIGTGSFRFVPNRGCFLETVPVDLVVNGLLAACWKNATRENKSETLVYNLTSGEYKISSAEWFRRCEDVTKRYPLPDYPFTPKLTIMERFEKNGRSWPLHALVYHEYVHRPLCYMHDVLNRLRGKQSRFLLNHKVYAGMGYLCTEHGMNDWYYANTRLRELYEQLDDEDKQNFRCIADIDYDQYVKDYWFGIRQHLFKQPVTPQELTSASDTTPSHVLVNTTSGSKS